MMAPEDYFQRYTESVQSTKILPASPSAEVGLALEGYYYPPYQKLETYLDTLYRADLLEILEQILTKEYPQQRFFWRQVNEYLDALQKLKNERAWQQSKMERLDAEIARCVHELASLEAERKRLETLVYEYQTEFENYKKSSQDLATQCAILRTTVTDLRTSTSWRVTAPLRFFSRIIKNNWLMRPSV